MTTTDNHYVTPEEFQQLLALAQKRKGGGVVQFVCSVLLIALAAVGGYFLLVIYLDAPLPPASAPTAAAASRPTAPAPFGGGGSGGSTKGSTLPDCATVTDTTTACVNTGGAASVEQPTPALSAPTGTPEPAYVTETCLTPPGARPCWLPADQAWEPPASVPETPIVLLSQWEGVPFVRDACVDWHPPQPWPEECDN